jgi:hypothetical protein
MLRRLNRSPAAMNLLHPLFDFFWGASSCLSELFARTSRDLLTGRNTTHPWYAATLSSLKTKVEGLRGVTSSSRTDI